MFQQLHIKICVIIILHLHITWSYQVYHLDADEENEVLSKLKQVLQGYDIPNYAEVKPKKSRHRFKPAGKSMFVKRIIPHGYKTGEHEYDSRLNTVFKPLFRYHITKPSAGDEKSVVRMEPKIRDTNNDLVSLMKKEPNSQDLLPHLKKYLEHDIKEKLKWKKTKKRFKSLLDRLSLKDELKLLRAFDIDKSGELHDPFAPGKVPDYLGNGNSEQTPDAADQPGSKVVIPSYPFWNYWTYQKTIVQDNCPGNLVKQGNMCVSPIGHRKNARRLRRQPERVLRYGLF
ncbi:uncharacterized protein LOC111351041 [Spodoptera litura]|uniref:Uncharacterized protein LOC111351041 n=1 Tax=Spodoptera litura TaxID=69820 RepID=A0A9J7DXB4_SPOLT|nr:uncharacterized protein LOC111351041 [Spodoptera litura]